MKTGLITITINRINKLLNPKQRKGGIMLLIGILVNALLDVLGLATILPLITVAMKPEILQENDLLNAVYVGLGFQSPNEFLLFLVLAIFGLFLMKNVYGLAMIYLQARFSTNLATDLSRQKYMLYIQKGYQLVKNIDSGNYITNVRNIPTIFAQSVMIPICNFLSEIVVVLIILVGIAAYNFQLIVILGLVMGFAFFVIYKLTRKHAQKISEERKVIAPKLIALINETIQGYIDIHIFNKSRYFLDSFMHNKIRENHLVKLHAFMGLLPAKVNELIAILGIVIVFVYSIFFAEGKNELLILLSLFAAAAYRIMPSMNRMLSALVSIKSHMYTLDVLEELHGIKLGLPPEYLPPMPFEHTIAFEGIQFTFEDGQHAVLSDINFVVKKGQQIGLVGGSGSGKTTLMRILLRLYAENNGCIKIDGVPITAQNKDAWIANLGFVQQQVYVMDGSMLENVAFGLPSEEADLQKAETALKQAQLWEFVSELPQGIHTPMGEFGSKLSGGQRQRVAIARALYKDASVFIFDEATSALDPETERMITESIDSLAKTGRTIFLIAHRFTTLQGCDRIFELANGKIINEYQYEDLIKEKLGLIQESP
ncbi:MAG: ABC transporter ATP-binding protein [Bacteroidota bacterium]